MVQCCVHIAIVMLQCSYIVHSWSVWCSVVCSCSISYRVGGGRGGGGVKSSKLLYYLKLWLVLYMQWVLFSSQGKMHCNKTKRTV